MKKLFLVVSLMMVLMIAPMAMADQVSTVGGYGPYQTGSGGEFTLKPDGGLSWVLNYYSGNPNRTRDYVETGTFQTFCVEHNEYVYPNSTFDVALSQKTIFTDKTLSVGAAWLYHQFQNGTLQGYNYVDNPDTTINERKVLAGALQNTIWHLMGWTDIPDVNFENLIPYANPHLANNGQIAVAVINMWEEGYLNQTGHERQDMLVCVPEPASMLLLGSGLIGLAGFARKRFGKKN